MKKIFAVCAVGIASGLQLGPRQGGFSRTDLRSILVRLRKQDQRAVQIANPNTTTTRSWAKPMENHPTSTDRVEFLRQ
jgi:hypothetical protein